MQKILSSDVKKEKFIVVHTRRKLDEKNAKMIPRFSLGGW